MNFEVNVFFLGLGSEADPSGKSVRLDLALADLFLTEFESRLIIKLFSIFLLRVSKRIFLSRSRASGSQQDYVNNRGQGSLILGWSKRLQADSPRMQGEGNGRHLQHLPQ